MTTKAQKTEIVNQARLYMSGKDLSQSKLARLAGISPAYMSDIMNGKLVTGPKSTPISDEYFVKLARAIGWMTKKTYWTHFDSDNYLSVIDTLNDARESKVPHAIDGNTGAGKSYAIEQYKLQYPKNTYIVACDDDLTAKSFMQELAYSVGLKPLGAAYNIRKMVIHKLENEPNALLIIDEAENLKDRAWGSIKRILDDLKGRCGIVFIGANEFEVTMKKKAYKMKACFPQVYSRIKEGGFTAMFPLSLEDVQGVCESFRITDKTVIRSLFDICENWRELAGAIKKLLRGMDQHPGEDIQDLFEVLFNVKISKTTKAQ
jgi:transcriptional regulator with XRE-family HTH domain